MIVAVIVACEIGFWVVLAAGLVSRYVLRRRRLSTALLAAVPLVDLVLLVVSVLDLRGASLIGWCLVMWLPVSVPALSNPA